MMEHMDTVIATVDAHEEDPEAVERGIRCLRNLAVDHDNRVALVAAVPIVMAAMRNHEEVEDLVRNPYGAPS